MNLKCKYCLAFYLKSIEEFTNTYNNSLMSELKEIEIEDVVYVDLDEDEIEEQFDPKLYESNNTEKIFQQAILDFKNISPEQITLSSTFEQTENDDTTNKNSNPHKRRKK